MRTGYRSPPPIAPLSVTHPPPPAARRQAGDIVSASLDLLAELTARYGAQLPDPEGLKAALLPELDESRAGVRKRAIQCLATLAACLPPNSLDDLCTRGEGCGAVQACACGEVRGRGCLCWWLFMATGCDSSCLPLSLQSLIGWAARACGRRRRAPMCRRWPPSGEGDERGRRSVSVSRSCTADCMQLTFCYVDVLLQQVRGVQVWPAPGAGGAAVHRAPAGRLGRGR